MGKSVNLLVRSGGKFWAIDQYTSIINDCATTYNLKTYIEGCGGGGKMITNLNSSNFKHRIYNEFDYEIATYFKVLADASAVKEFYTLLTALYKRYDAKYLFAVAKANKGNKDLTAVQVAVLTFILSFTSYRGGYICYNQESFERHMLRLQTPEKIYDNSVNIRDIHVTNNDCVELIRKFNDCKDTFYFGDHPYWGTKVYSGNLDWEDEKYIEVVKLLQVTKMKVMICDTNNVYYDELVQKRGWHKYFIKTKRNNMATKKGKQNNSVLYEHIWTNFIISEDLLQGEAKMIA